MRRGEKGSFGACQMAAVDWCLSTLSQWHLRILSSSFSAGINRGVASGMSCIEPNTTSVVMRCTCEIPSRCATIIILVKGFNYDRSSSISPWNVNFGVQRSQLYRLVLVRLSGDGHCDIFHQCKSILTATSQCRYASLIVGIYATQLFIWSPDSCGIGGWVNGLSDRCLWARPGSAYKY